MKPQVIGLKEISQRFKAEEFNVGQDLEIGNINTLDMAKEGEISFIVRKKFLPVARVSLASAFIAPKGLVVDDRPTLCVDEVWKVVKELINYFYPSMMPQPGIAPEARIGRDVLLGKDIYVGPYTIIEDEVSIGDSSMIASHCYVGRKAKLGANTVIYPQVTIMHDVIIGDRVIIHPGAVIGSDGFKYEIIDGQRQKIPQVGRVIIEDDVEIGANSCIDRATLTETRIGQGTKIDNLVQIGHNVKMGRNCVLVGQVGIAGSSSLGNNVILGGQVGIADNLKLGDNVAVGAQSGVRKDIPAGEYHFGSPSLPMKEFSRMLALMSNLPKMHKKLNELWAIIKEKKPKD